MPSRPIRAWRPLALVALIAGLGWSARFMPGLRHWIEAAQSGHLAIPWLLAGGVLYCALGLPRQALSLACGLTCGTGLGMAVVTLATVTGSAIAYGVAALFIRPGARGRNPDDGQLREGPHDATVTTSRLAALRARLAGRPFRAVLVLRLMPVGSALLVNLASGAYRIGFWPFLTATLIGGVPQSLIFVLLGAGTRIGQSTQFALAGGLTVLSIALGIVLMRRDPDRT